MTRVASVFAKIADVETALVRCRERDGRFVFRELGNLSMSCLDGDIRKRPA